MSKYTPLTQYLDTLSVNSAELTFEEVEDIIGSKLPESARHYYAWWANEKFGSHVWATEWMDAGWRMDRVSFTDCRVGFKRDGTL